MKPFSTQLLASKIILCILTLLSNIVLISYSDTGSFGELIADKNVPFSQNKKTYSSVRSVFTPYRQTSGLAINAGYQSGSFQRGFAANSGFGIHATRYGNASEYCKKQQNKCSCSRYTKLSKSEKEYNKFKNECRQLRVAGDRLALEQLRAKLQKKMDAKRVGKRLSEKQKDELRPYITAVDTQIAIYNILHALKTVPLNEARALMDYVVSEVERSCANFEAIKNRMPYDKYCKYCDLITETADMYNSTYQVFTDRLAKEKEQALLQQQELKEQENQKKLLGQREIRERELNIVDELHNTRFEKVVAEWEKKSRGKNSKRYQNRINALHDVINPIVPVVLSEQAHEMLQDFGFSQKNFKAVYDHNLQQTLHNELVAIANKMPALYKKFRDHAPLHRLNKLTLESVEVARSYNDLGDLVTSSKMADFCWASYDFLYELSAGAFEGVQVGAQNLCAHSAHFMTDIFKTVASGLEYLSLGVSVEECHTPQELRRLAVRIGEMEAKIGNEILESTAFKIGTSILSTILLGTEIEHCSMPQEMIKLMPHVDEVCDQAISVVKHCATLPPRDMSRAVTSLGVELFLTKQIVTSAGELCQSFNVQPLAAADATVFAENVIVGDVIEATAVANAAKAKQTAKVGARAKHAVEVGTIEGGTIEARTIEALESSNVAGRPSRLGQRVVGEAEAVQNGRAAQEVVELFDPTILHKDFDKVCQQIEKAHPYLKKHLKKIKRLHKQIAVIVEETPFVKVGEMETGLTLIGHKKLENKTIEFYEKMRMSNIDIELISNNTGISKDIIEKIKKHIFIEEHLTYAGVARFDPESNMAAAWQRLMNNNFVQSDLLLLMHEYAESFIMDGIKVEWRVAHDIVIQFYNWDKSL